MVSPRKYSEWRRRKVFNGPNGLGRITINNLTKTPKWAWPEIRNHLQRSNKRSQKFGDPSPFFLFIYYIILLYKNCRTSPILGVFWGCSRQPNVHHPNRYLSGLLSDSQNKAVRHPLLRRRPSCCTHGHVWQKSAWVKDVQIEFNNWELIQPSYSFKPSDIDGCGRCMLGRVAADSPNHGKYKEWLTVCTR